MGLKTTIGSQGVVTEQVSGNDQLIVTIKSKKGVQNHPNATTTGSVGASPIQVFEAASSDVVVQLPTVSADNVGLEYTIINADISNDLILSASTGQHIDSGALTLTVAEEAASIVAVSSSLDGYGWFVTHLKA